MSASPTTHPFGVLVVDDEDLVRLILMEAVEDEGLHAFGAASADEALAVLGGGADVDVAVIDVDLVGPMDGLQLAHILRQRWPHIGIVMSSGLVRILGRDLPAHSIFLAKPYSLDEAIRVIRAMRETVVSL